MHAGSIASPTVPCAVANHLPSVVEQRVHHFFKHQVVHFDGGSHQRSELYDNRIHLDVQVQWKNQVTSEGNFFPLPWVEGRIRSGVELIPNARGTTAVPLQTVGCVEMYSLALWYAVGASHPVAMLQYYMFAFTRDSWKFLQSTSLAKSQKALEARSCKPWVTNLSIVPHTLGILTANIT